MAEFKMVMREFRRLCEGKKCTDCPIWEKVDKDAETFCSAWLTNHSEEAERIIMRWAKENPLMTNRMKFKEIFGIEFTDRVAESQYHREWLDAEYKGGTGWAKLN